MNRILAVLAGAGAGAGTMYLFDPVRGRRRRARLRDAAVHASRMADAAMTTTSLDVEHRMSGLAARTRSRLVDQPPLSDQVLAERVRARLGRLVSHAGAIDVKASSGTVTLSGPVFEAELDQLIKGVAAVAGVNCVETRLEPHRAADRISALQGRGPRTVPGVAARWFRWTPTARVVAGLGGLTLLAFSRPNRPLRGAATAIAGIELLERALIAARGGT